MIQKWQNKMLFQKQAIEPTLSSWLLQAYNLTETIKKTGAEFSLEVISQSFSKPYSEEQHLFKQSNNSTSYFIRKVLLKGNQIPLIFARVIIPTETYSHYQLILSELGDKPIGNTLLYADKRVKRGEFEFKLFKGQQNILNPLAYIINDDETVWARRSLFILPKGSLLIVEFFLNSLSKLSLPHD